MKDGEVRVDLKAEIIEERVHLVKQWIHTRRDRLAKTKLGIREGFDSGYELGGIHALESELQFLSNLLKHEAFQTTEPCMTKKEMSAE